MKRRRLGKMARREEKQFYFFISPWLVGLFFFTGGPIVASLLISLTKWSLLETPQWIGFANYLKLIKDPYFYKVLVNTAYYSSGVVILGTAGALIAALLLNKELFGIGLFRTIYFLPTVTSGVAMIMVFMWLYNPVYGLFNSLIRGVGLYAPPWIYDEHWAMPALILMSLWGIGTNMVIFLAGLQGIPKSLYEAARVDGANWWVQLWHVTLPSLSPIIFLVIVLATIGSFQVFMQPYIMTEGGPNNATLTWVLYIYQNGFQWWKMGYASSLAWILLIVLLGLAFVHFRISRYWVYYEVEVK